MPGGVSGGSAGPEVKNLEQFERQRAAIETIFTLSLLYIATLQVWTSVNRQVNFWLAITPVVILLIIALSIGGRNLLEQLKPSWPLSS